MKAILIQYKPATNSNPSRYRLTAEQCKPMTFSLDYGLNDEEQHLKNVKAFAIANGWGNLEFIIGQLPTGHYCAVINHTKGA